MDERALAASTRLAMGLSSSVVAKEKSVSSLLSRKPLFVMRRAEPVLDGGRHRHRIAVAVDDGDVARAELDPFGRPPEEGLLEGRIAGLGLAHGLVRVDQSSAALDIARIGQALDRHVDEGRIGEEERPVGIARRPASAIQ